MTESNECTFLYEIRDKLEEYKESTQLTCAEFVIQYMCLDDHTICELCGSLINLLRGHGIELKGTDDMPMFYQYEEDDNE